MNDKLKCSYCGKIKEKVSFFIGAKLESDVNEWTMHEGTGKMSCPNCFPKGKAEAQLVIDKYVGKT